MARDDELRIPEPRFSVADVHAPLRILSLSGGGYRGLFTACTLVELCSLARVSGSVRPAIDVFAGTSIGGLMACALALDVPPRRVLDAFDASAAAVFPKKKFRRVKRALFGSLYQQVDLAKAIDDSLGEHKRTLLSEVEAGLVIPAVDWVKGTVRLYLSAFFGAANASQITLRDACLATSAAPTYFDPADVEGTPMLDGGLAANNPDMLALGEVFRRRPDALARIEMLSIGTAGHVKDRAAKQATKSGLGWASDLSTFMIDVQERSAAEQAGRLLGDRYLRINHDDEPGNAFETIDVATDETRAALLRAGVDTAVRAYAGDRAHFIDRFFNVSRKMGPYSNVTGRSSKS